MIGLFSLFLPGASPLAARCEMYFCVDSGLLLVRCFFVLLFKLRTSLCTCTRLFVPAPGSLYLHPPLCTCTRLYKPCTLRSAYSSPGPLPGPPSLSYGVPSAKQPQRLRMRARTSKLKVGGGDPATEGQWVGKMLNACQSTGRTLRLDANQAWRVEQVPPSPA